MKTTWIIAAILITIVPLLSGVLLTEITNKERTLGRAFVYGWISIFSIVEIFALPLIFLGKSLTMLTVLVTVACMAVILAGIYMGRKNIFDYVKNTFSLVKQAGIIWLLPAGLMLVQMYNYFMKVNADADDAFYLATASTAVATDSIYKFEPYTGELYTSLPSRYVLSPLPLLYSIIGKISGLHVAIIAHTLIPVIMVLVTYLVYTMIGRALYSKDMKKTGMFLFYVALIFTFSAVTTHTTGVVFLVRIWQGKAMLAAYLLPLIFATLFENGRQALGVKNCIILMVILLASCFVSSMGILLGPLCLGMALIVYFIFDKKIKWVLPGFFSCIPSIILAMVYLFIR